MVLLSQLTSYPGLPMFFNVAHEKGEGLVDYDEKCAFSDKGRQSLAINMII